MVIGTRREIDRVANALLAISNTLIEISDKLDWLAVDVDKMRNPELYPRKKAYTPEERHRRSVAGKRAYETRLKNLAAKIAQEGGANGVVSPE